VLGAVEAGGTKFRVASVDQDSLDVIDEVRIETTDPDSTIGATIDFLRSAKVGAVGVAAFGPLDLDRISPTYGSITATPKPGWSDTPLRRRLMEALDVPVGIQTDVEGAAMAEFELGAGRDCSTLVYVTVGTGIGAGITIDGRPHGGHGHSEFGHVPMTPVAGDNYTGRCPFHGTCAEGMASGPAIEDRWGRSGDGLADAPEVWDLEAVYLAQLVRIITYTVAPHRILFGGGVAQAPGLMERLRRAVAVDMAGYGTNPRLLGDLDTYLQPAALGQEAGLIGAALIARMTVG